MSQNLSLGSDSKEKVEDLILIKNIKKNSCGDSLLELISRHEGLYYKISHKYSSTNTVNGPSVDDIADDKNYMIYQAALAFDPKKKVKFSTWLGNYVRYARLNAINKNSKFIKVEEDSLEYFFSGKAVERHEDLKLKDENEFIFNILRQLKDKRIHTVFRLRYFSGHKKMTWARIAKQLEVSTQTAINLHDKGRKVLIKKYRSKSTNMIDNI